MRYFIIYFFIIFGPNALEIPTNSIVGPSIIKKINSGKIYTHSQVDTVDPNKQSLDFKIAGIHPKSCKKAFRKISRYENYQSYLNVVTKSTYNDQNQRLFLSLNSALLPFNMNLDFVMPRIKRPGTYKFYFDKGFLKGLVGTIIVQKYNKRCLVTSHAVWLGAKSKIPNLVFELFLDTVGKLAMERLFRLSKN